MNGLIHSQLKSLELLNQGKVRDIYNINDDKMLIVTTDRISAFDVIMKQAIPLKGKVLTQMANFWFKKIDKIIPNHLTHEDPLNFVHKEDSNKVKNRAIVVRKLKPIPVEAIVRGYLIGSGWRDYQMNQSVCGINLPQGLKLAEQLLEPIFTPSNKAKVGDKDENISIKECESLIGKNVTEQIAKKSIEIYKYAFNYAYQKDIIIADTKFEFGVDNSGKIYIIDEVLTPDSSRFWPMDSYQTGISPPSFDKQFVRDWLEGIDWNKSPPPPDLPIEIIEKTSQKYQEVLAKLTGEKVNN
ncbi:MAG: phosphoribosylaminoimidazolesuccinocarboxamide synthase [Methylophilaceae bacterium]